MCSAETGTKKKNSIAGKGGKKWKKQQTAKESNPWELHMWRQEPWSQAHCGYSIRVRIRRKSKHSPIVGMGLERGSDRKVQAPKYLTSDILFIFDIELAFWKGSTAVATCSVLLIPLGVEQTLGKAE